jgi:hypothetical protein
MSQASGSALTQSFADPGQLILAWFDPDNPGAPAAVTVSFNAGHAVLLQPQFAPIQRINVADNGRIYVLQLSANEELHWSINFQALPWEDDTHPDMGRNTAGMQSLRRFIRDTLNYSEQQVQITSPDGEIEVMLYVGGLETAVEGSGALTGAAGMPGATKHLQWDCRLEFRRYL